MADSEDQGLSAHEFTCPYEECEGRVPHLLADAAALREAVGEVLAASGFKDRLEHADLAPLRRAVANYDRSPAT